MQRLNDSFVETLDEKIGLKGKVVLEVGCGDGGKSVALASRCSELKAIDPDQQAIAAAKQGNARPNLAYSVGSAENLAFANGTFDLVIFTLSLHHVPVAHMQAAIAEAKRVSKAGGKVVFLEPGLAGGLFEAEILFGAGDGDERKVKAAAYSAMLDSQLLADETEYFDEVTFAFESDQDFIDDLQPKTNLSQIHDFLQTHNHKLTAQRRINIFSFR